MAVHFLNLTNGIACGPHAPNAHFIRVQSTWCEQKRWEDVLWTISDDFLWHMAVGATCVVHDRSERPRRTRACWQGIPFIRHAAHRAWGLEPVPAPAARSGMDMRGYFDRVISPLVEERVWKRLTYFNKYRPGCTDVRVCDGRTESEERGS